MTEEEIEELADKMYDAIRKKDVGKFGELI
jgi:hypothetical protein